jgi:exodeoxyribonuclease-5
VSEPLVLCATNRLAQSLRGEIAPGAVASLTRRALTIGQWLGQLADEARIAGLAELPEPLDPFAERVLWETAIEPSLAAAGPLFDLPGMAATAAEAHALCRAWNLAPGVPALSDEARLFLDWQARFEEKCRAAGWLDASGVERQVLRLIEDGRFALPEAVAFAGFDRLTPCERRLADALGARGTAVEFCPPGAVDRGSASVIACADPAAECAAAATWARERLAAAPDARLAIVVPDLTAVR